MLHGMLRRHDKTLIDAGFRKTVYRGEKRLYIHPDSHMWFHIWNDGTVEVEKNGKETQFTLAEVTGSIVDYAERRL